MTIKEALAQARAILGSGLEREMLLAHALGRRREYCIAHSQFAVGAGALRRFFALCKRRARGEPIAYIVKCKEFFGVNFYVDKRVLIPRPETEHLVEEVLACAWRDSLTILDIGTGSGAIAVTLAKLLPRAQIFASDISKTALSVARKNAKAHGVSKNIQFKSGDLLQPWLKNKFDIIVANLPYVPRRQTAFVEVEVKKYEPKEALWAGVDGLFFLRRFLSQLKIMKHTPRFVICEFGFSMKRSVAALVNTSFPTNLSPRHGNTIFKKDVAGKDRYFVLSFN